MGKKKGKIFASIFGFALGFANPAFFGAGTAAFTAGMYGASLASNLWSMSHKPKIANDYGRFDQLMNTVSSQDMIPVIFGRRRWAGNQTHHKPSSDKQTLVKDVVLCEGEIEGVEHVAANDMPILDTPYIKIKYTGSYGIATHSVRYGIREGLKIINKEDRMFSLDLWDYVYVPPYGDGNGDTYEWKVAKSLRFNMNDKQPVDLLNWINQQDGFEAKELVSYFALSLLPDKDVSSSNTNFKNAFGSVIVSGLPNCSYEFHNGSATQQPPSNHADVGSYKNMAWLRVTLKLSERLQGSNPTITCVVKGKKVNVYRNGAWYYEWSDNPVWCVRDYCLSRRYGLGRWFTASDFDNDACLESADYCDGLVTYKDENGNTKQEKRYALNIILDQKRDAVDQLSDMLCNFAGYFSFSPYSVAIRIEKETSKSYDFIDATIVTDSVKFAQKTDDENYNRYTVGYFDPNNNWTQVKVLLEDFPGQKTSGKVVNSDVTFPGTISQSQALRLTRLLKDVTKLCPINMSFQTATMAMHLQCGDVVNVTYKNYFTNKPFRIQAIDENNGIWTLTCREYNGTIYNDQLGAEIQVKNYNYIDSPITGNVPDVSNLALTQTYYRQGDGTIVSDVGINFDAASYQFLRQYVVDYSIDNGVNWTNYVNTLHNKVVLHNAIVKATYLIRIRVQNSASRLSDGLVSDPILITGKDAPPSNVATLNAVVDQSDRTKITLTWSEVDDIDLRGYRLLENGTILTPTPISDTRYIYTATESRTHTFAVVAVDNSENHSDTPATKTLSVTVEPPSVPGFTAIPQETDRSQLILNWSAVQAQDLSYYEIRRGNDSWEAAEIIATQLKSTRYLHQLTAEGYQTYMVKAYAVGGHASASAASASLQVTLRPDAPTNLVAVQEPRDRSMVKITWTTSPGKDIAGYEIRYGNSGWDSGTPINTATDAQYWWYVPASGTYNIMIKAKTVAGYYSNVANVTIAATIEPYDVTGFTAMQSMSDRTKVTLMWDIPQSLDVAYFVIKKGVSWDAGVVVGQRVTGTFYDVIVLEETEQTFWIKAVSTAGKEGLNPSKITSIFNLNPSPVTDIVLAQDPNDKSILNISYKATPESDLANYEIRVGYVWQDAIVIGETKELRWIYSPPATGDVKIMIKAVNAAGYYSDKASASLYVTLEPGNVSGFRVFQNGDKLMFVWNPVSDNDVVGYELREGGNYDNGTIVATGITLTQYQLPVDTEILRRFHVKAINRSGHESRFEASVNINISDLPPKNVIQSYDEIVLQSGTQDGTEFGESLITFSTLPGRFSDYQSTKFSDIGGAMVLKLSQVGGVYPTSGTYTCARKDLGQIITANIATVFQPSILYTAGTTASLEYRTSRDEITWTDWQQFSPLEATFRYADFRVLLATADVTKTPEVNQLLIRVDVPDKDIAKSVVVPVGGITVHYGHTFYEFPIVTPTAEGTVGRAVWYNKTKSTVDLMVVNNVTGADIGGNTDLRVKGY